MKQVETFLHQDEKVYSLEQKTTPERERVGHGPRQDLKFLWECHQLLHEHQLCEQGHSANLGYLGKNLTLQELIYISHFCPLFPSLTD